MKNLFAILALATVFAFTVNAQSKDCCTKDKSETTKMEKCDKEKVSMKSGGDKVETSTTKVLSNEKVSVQKDVVVTKNQMNKKENCGDNSSCCDMKKEKKSEKESEKKQ